MSWQGIAGHDEIVDRMRRALRKGRLASSFLFVGPEGVGKRTFAAAFAKALLCSRRADELLDPCGECLSCRMMAADNHPDFDLVSKPADKSFLPLSLLIGEKDRRMHEGLAHRMTLKPSLAGRRIAVIDDADSLNAEGANCLLKLLEEPPTGSLLILIGTSEDRQLPTTRSRCQTVRFRPLPAAELALLLVAQGLTDTRKTAERAARLSDGGLRSALEALDGEVLEFRDMLRRRLAQVSSANSELIDEVLRFVEAAGKDATARRERTRMVLTGAIDFYRGLLRTMQGVPTDAVPTEEKQFSDVSLRWREKEPAQRCSEKIGRLVDCCLDALEHVDRNAHVSNVVGGWLDELATITAAAA